MVTYGAAAELLGRAPHLRRPSGVALLLPGGDESSDRPLPRRDVSVLRMRAFEGAIETMSHGRVVAYTLKYRVSGWNGAASDPVVDARWALREIGRRHPGLPVVLIGHSMGGRAALRVAEMPTVAGICALAPWITAEEHPENLGFAPLLVLHAPNDVATDATRSKEFVAQAQALGVQAEWRPMRFDNHPMLLRAMTWHALAARFVLRCVTATEGHRPRLPRFRGRA